MPFRERQRFNPAFNTPVAELEVVTTPEGEVEVELVDQSDKAMPDPELFDLKNQLKAGIQPEEVQSTIMSASTVNGDAVVRKYTKKSTTQEVKDEN